MAFAHGFLFPSSVQVLAHVFSAASHPARVTMLSRLITTQGWTLRSDLVDQIPLTQISLSQHLRKLRIMGIVESRNVSNTTEYRLAENATVCGLLLQQVFTFATNNVSGVTDTSLLEQLNLKGPDQEEE